MRFTFVLFISCLLNTNLAFGQVTQLRSPDCNRLNTTLNKTLYASIATATNYRFKVTNITTGITDSIDKLTRSFKLNEIPSVSRYNCLYAVQVNMDNGTGFEGYGGICNPESIALITSLRSSDCGRSLNSISQTIYASLATADSWTFEVRNVTNIGVTDVVSGLLSRAFNLSMTSSIDFQLLNQEYEIRVKTIQGGVEQPYGAWCSIFTPNVITTLRPSDCGRLLTQINTPLYAQVDGADSYDFEIRNVLAPGVTEVISTPTRLFRLTMASAPFQLYNQEYEIRVRTIWDGVIMPYGDWCSVFSPPNIGPDITGGCGNTFEYLAYEYLTCTDIGATQYQWLLRIGSTFIDTLYTTTNQARLAEFLDGSNQPTYDYGQAYNIAARGLVAGFWTPYGTGCSISTTTNAHTEVQHLCDEQLNSFNTPISVFAIFSATNYEFEVTDLTGGDGVQTINKTVRKVKLNELPMFSYGHEYSIRCRVTFKGAVFDYSTACSVTAPQPITQLRPSDCPRALSTMNKKVYANPLIYDSPNGLDPVESYQFRSGGNVSVWKSTRDITLIEILGVAPTASTSYPIEVRAKYDGVEQAYGNACTVTTPSSMIILDGDISSTTSGLMKTQSLVNIHPNPSDDYFVVTPLKNIEAEQMHIEIFDIRGGLMESVTVQSNNRASEEIILGRDLPKGIYFIYLYDGTTIFEVKKIRKI